jgi:sulfur carrier protein ThiS
MKVQIKLFSVLRDIVPDYDPTQGITLDLAHGTTVAQLLKQLEIPMAKIPVVTCNGRVLSSDTTLQNDCLLHIFQPVAGG